MGPLFADCSLARRDIRCGKSPSTVLMSVFVCDRRFNAAARLPAAPAAGQVRSNGSNTHEGCATEPASIFDGPANDVEGIIEVAAKKLHWGIRMPAAEGR